MAPSFVFVGSGNNSTKTPEENQKKKPRDMELHAKKSSYGKCEELNTKVPSMNVEEPIKIASEELKALLQKQEEIKSVSDDVKTTSQSEEKNPTKISEISKDKTIQNKPVHGKSTGSKSTIQGIKKDKKGRESPVTHIKETKTPVYEGSHVIYSIPKCIAYNLM